MRHAALVWDRDLATYDMGETHPLNPLRLTLTVALMEAYGLLGRDRIISPRTAAEAELLLVHDIDYIEAVRLASDWSAGLNAGMGLATEDNPIFPGMHDAAALVCGASMAALEQVLSGERTRAFSIAGGLHHAHRRRAAGFSVYNDPAVAIAAARAKHPGLRVLYIDIDAHHGDGVQEAFFGESEVMTISLHQDGSFAFPGTGFPGETGYAEGVGAAVNVPLPHLATDECFQLAFSEVVEPLARAFRPDVVVAQLGVDAHHLDPQTEVSLTFGGYRDLVRRIIALADELCEGKLAALGGGGYEPVRVVPLAWTWVLAALLDEDIPDELPESWRTRVLSEFGVEAPTSLGAHDACELPAEAAARARERTRQTIQQVQDAVFRHHGLTP